MYVCTHDTSLHTDGSVFADLVDFSHANAGSIIDCISDSSGRLLEASGWLSHVCCRAGVEEFNLYYLKLYSI